MIINHGRVQYDGPLYELSPYKIIRVSTRESVRTLEVPRADVARVTAELLQTLEVTDLAVGEPALEDVIDRAYRDGIGTSA
jgi:ABC-type uncharacterized transport system ATPase subunit